MIGEAEALRWIESPESDHGARRGFCGTCGSSLFWQAAGGERIGITAGTLDPPTGLRVAAHIYTHQASDYEPSATGYRATRIEARWRSAGAEVVAKSTQGSPEAAPILARLTDLLSPLREPLRIRCLPPRAGGRRARGDRGARHARAHADRFRQVAHVPARRDASPRADARAVAAHRAHEGPGRQAAAADRRDRDLRQLVALRRGNGVTAGRCYLRRDAPRVRRARAPAAVTLRRGSWPTSASGSSSSTRCTA